MAVPPQAVIEIQTNSEEMPNWQNLPAPVPPTITMNGEAFATLPAPGAPNGWQLVVLNSGGDLTNPDNILLNEYIQLQDDNGSWGSTYGWMYIEMVRDILSAGNIEEQLLILATFGLDGNMPPSNDAYEFLLERGAGQQLQTWEQGDEAGSQGSEWIGSPASYILVGGSSFNYGEGYEAFNFPSGSTAPASLSVTLENNVPPAAD